MASMTIARTLCESCNVIPIHVTSEIMGPYIVVIMFIESVLPALDTVDVLVLMRMIRTCIQSFLE